MLCCVFQIFVAPDKHNLLAQALKERPLGGQGTARDAPNTSASVSSQRDGINFFAGARRPSPAPDSPRTFGHSPWRGASAADGDSKRRRPAPLCPFSRQRLRLPFLRQTPTLSRLPLPLPQSHPLPVGFAGLRHSPSPIRVLRRPTPLPIELPSAPGSPRRLLQ